MYNVFKDYGTALYLRRGMQKRAAAARNAVDYLEKVGVFGKSAEEAPVQQPQQSSGLNAADLAVAGGVGAAGLGAGYRLAGKAAPALERTMFNRAVNKAYGKGFEKAYESAGGKDKFLSAAREHLNDLRTGKDYLHGEGSAVHTFEKARRAENSEAFGAAKEGLKGIERNIGRMKKVIKPAGAIAGGLGAAALLHSHFKNRNQQQEQGQG